MAPPARARPSPKSRMPRQRRGKRHDDHHRREQIVGGSLCVKLPEEMRHHGCRDRGGGAVRSSDGEGEGTPRGDDSRADCRGQEGRGYAVGDPGGERRGEDQGSERQAIGHRHDAGDQAGEDVSGESRDLSGYRAIVGSGCTIDGHASEPFKVSTLIVLALLWRDSAGDA